MINYTPIPTRHPPQPKTYPICSLKKAMDIIKASAAMFMSRKGMAKDVTKQSSFPNPNRNSNQSSHMGDDPLRKYIWLNFNFFSAN